jgi:hypothetical protein
MNTCKIGRSKGRSLAIRWLLSGFIATAPASVMADTLEMTKDAGLGAGAAVASLVYAPAKLCYAVGGMVIGGLAWAFSCGDQNVAKVVLTPSVLGDYVITPDHLRGEQPVEFFGREPEQAPEEQMDLVASPVEPDNDQAW